MEILSKINQYLSSTCTKHLNNYDTLFYILRIENMYQTKWEIAYLNSYGYGSDSENS